MIINDIYLDGIIFGFYIDNIEYNYKFDLYMGSLKRSKNKNLYLIFMNGYNYGVKYRLDNSTIYL